ncbi:MAG: Gfo/Idh/MocA family oxidoreductase, partial [Candidatus Kapaibacterium sp.]
MIKIGVIGCGYWGPNLIRNFHGLPNAKVKTVSDLRSGRLDYIKENYPDINTTEDFNDIISDSEIDAIVIVTPVTTHRELAELALKAGKHTFVEKPLAHTSK